MFVGLGGDAEGMPVEVAQLPSQGGGFRLVLAQGFELVDGGSD